MTHTPTPFTTPSATKLEPHQLAHLTSLVQLLNSPSATLGSRLQEISEYVESLRQLHGLTTALPALNALLTRTDRQ
jgi:hypothetical protein